MSRGRFRDYYPPSQPLEAKGGIKAQSGRSGFARHWWAKRWVAVLESFNIRARLARGRAYARKGQVLDIHINEGEVRAKVQGSRRTPYTVRINVKTLDSAQWERVLNALAGQATYAAGLLAGEMPQDIEQVFTAADVALFPQKVEDLTTKCSCPDWSNPCKHIAAVYYIIGEEFDRDPFLLFLLRGMPRERLLDELRRCTAGTEDAELMEPESEQTSEPLPTDTQAFWSGAPVAAGGLAIENTEGSAALLKRLGPFPLWRGERPILEALLPVYKEAAARVQRLEERQTP